MRLSIEKNSTVNKIGFLFLLTITGTENLWQWSPLKDKSSPSFKI